MPVRKPHVSQPVSAAVFPTSLGWFAVACSGTAVTRVMIGFPSRAAGWTALEAALESVPPEMHPQSEICRLLQDYAAGANPDLSQLELSWEPTTPFTEKVRRLVRAIPYGETRGYGELAALAGHPGAARAVGTVMAKNPLPILIPCHRVLASQGKIGGFSARDGVNLKRRMLALEQGTEAQGLAATLSLPIGGKLPQRRRG